jgi:hypothetical protein
MARVSKGVAVNDRLRNVIDISVSWRRCLAFLLFDMYNTVNVRLDGSTVASRSLTDVGWQAAQVRGYGSHRTDGMSLMTILNP